MQIVFEHRDVGYLRVGTPLQLMFPDGPCEVHGAGALIGWKEGLYVVTELPYSGGRSAVTAVGAPCIVRYTLDGKLVGYRTRVRAWQTEPEALLFLGFPDTVEEILLRKHPRIAMHQPVLIFPVDRWTANTEVTRKAPFDGLMTDLSVQGCHAAIADPAPELRPDARVRLEFELPGIGRIANLTGVVKNRDSRSSRTHVGLEFQFQQMEFIELRGWGKTVQQAIEHFVAQRHPPAA